MGRNHARFWATGITDSGGTTSLVYDYEDRVTSITRPGMTTNTFAYDGFGARVSKTDSSGTTTYLRSGTSVVAPVVADSQATYTPGISERRGTESRFYHGDIKNFVEQTDSSGQIVSSQQYDAFGNPVSSTGTWQGPFAYGGRFGYQSDSDTSLSLLGHRYYDPTTGRFLSRDPIKDGRNWYVYCDNNPLTRVDPTGLWRAIVGGILGGIAGGILGGPAGALAGVALGSALGDAADQAAENPDGSINWGRAAAVGAFSAVVGWASGKLAGWLGKRFGPAISGLIGKLLGRGGSRAAPEAAGGLAEAEFWPGNGLWPKRALPRTPSGEPVPDSPWPHTQLGTRYSKSKPGTFYKQAIEWGEDGKLIRRIDFTDHGRPGTHPNPHYHEWLNPGWSKTPKPLNAPWMR